MNTRLLTLINQPFYIERAYGESQLPLLFAVLNGKSIDAAPKTKDKEDTILQKTRLDAAGGSSSSNNQYVGVIEFTEPIYKYDQECGPVGTKTKIGILNNLAEDPNCAGVVLNIDSGGGQAYGTPELYDQIRDFSKPVISYTDGLMASAAYYIGSAADEIIANKRAEAIGSIGAYTQFFDLSGWYEDQGIKSHEVYATKSTEKNRAYREALKGNYDLYVKEELDPLVDQFIDDMKAARSDIKKEVFKGATYSGPASVEKGLVDSLGTLEDAINRVFELQKTNTNTKTKTTMSKEKAYPNLEKVLGLEEPLASNENGSFLNEDQKESLDNYIKENSKSTRESAVQAENEKSSKEMEKLRNQLSEEKESNKAMRTSINELASLAGVEDVGKDSTDQTIAAATEKVKELNATPGSDHTTSAEPEGDESKHPYIDFGSSIYKPLKN